MSQYPDHLQLHLLDDPPIMANNKKQQKKQRAVFATASHSKVNQKKNSAASSSMGNQQDRNDQPAATAEGSQDSIMGTIIKGIKGFTIDSAESIILKNDADKDKNEANDSSADNENVLVSEWQQVDLRAKVNNLSDDKDKPIENKSKSKDKAKATSLSQEEDDDIDREWEHVEAENSLNDDTIFTLDADRHLCTLWFFTTHSFSTMASLLNYSLDRPLPIRLHGDDTKARFLELMKTPDNPRAFIVHEIQRISLTKNVEWDRSIQQAEGMFTEAWIKMKDDISEERELGERALGGKTYDNLSDAEYLKRVGKERLWSVKERKAIQDRTWGGLGAKVTRPSGENLGSHLDVYTQGVRLPQTMKLGKKSGLLGWGSRLGL